MGDMDKIIDPSVVNRRRLKKLLIATAVLIVLLLLWFLLRSSLQPTIPISQIRIASVERGNVDANIDAVGILEPGIEQSITSPLESIVTAVYVFPGETVTEGQPLLQLENIEQARLVSELEEKLLLKQNEQQVSQLELQAATDDLNASLELKKIDLEYRKARHRRLSSLSENGGVSKDQLLEASLDVTRTEVEIDQLHKSIGNQTKTNEATLTRIQLETSILEGQLAQAHRVLEQTTVRAPSDGYLAFLLEQVGESVTRGTELARVSDPESFRVKARLSDFYANRIRAGMSVTIRDGERQWPGRLSRIIPEADNGSLSLIIDFEDRQIAGLRMQQRVDTELLLDDNPDMMRVARGPGIGRTGTQQLFIVNGDMAERRDVTVGVSNRQFVSLESGVLPGEQIITTDMSDYLHLESIKINQE